MRKRALLAIAVFAVGASAWAANFGPVDVVALPGLGGTANAGDYAEYRFQIHNRDGRPHYVELVLVTVGWRGVEQRTRRRVQVAPRAFAEVRMYQPTRDDEAGTELAVVVDGDEKGEPLRVRSGYEERRPQVLMSRSFPDVNFRSTAPPSRSAPYYPGSIPYTSAAPATPAGFSHRVTRAALAPGLWSTTWLAYTPHDAVLVTDGDWNEFPAAVRNAILRYVRAGGNLVLSGDPRALPDFAMERTIGPFRVASLAFGRIYQHDDLSQALDAQEILKAVGQWNRWSLRTLDRAPLEEFPLLGSARVPTGALFSTLIVFAIAAGPVSLTMLARKNRRLWIFWTVPILAVITSAAIIGTSLGVEGWQRLSRSGSITLLDENTGEATTLGLIGFYATVPPDGDIRFSPETEIRAFGGIIDTSSDLDTTDGQRLLSGWVRSRVSTYFAFRKNERRRERLVLRSSGAALTAMNGFGAPIRTLFVADEHGSVFQAKNVAAGAEVTLTPMNTRVREAAPWDEAGPPEVWPSHVARLEANPLPALRPGTYIAILSRSPFAEHALEDARTSSAEGVVIGIARRGTGAS